MSLLPKTFEFSIQLDAPRDLAPETMQALHEAGCDDATPSMRDGRLWLIFAREGGTLDEAIGSALADLKKTGFQPAMIYRDTR